jgi:hypothetical protein
METKAFIIACCVFCFITGMYVAHMIDKGRGCTVAFSRGNVTHVMVGVKS